MFVHFLFQPNCLRKMVESSLTIVSPRYRCVEDTQSDFVEFSNFNVKLKDRKMDRYCGTMEDSRRKTVKSDGNFFRVTFKSNNVYDATGFEAFYQFRKYHGAFFTFSLNSDLPSKLPRKNGLLALFCSRSMIPGNNSWTFQFGFADPFNPKNGPTAGPYSGGSGGSVSTLRDLRTSAATYCLLLFSCLIHLLLTYPVSSSRHWHIPATPTLQKWHHASRYFYLIAVSFSHTGRRQWANILVVYTCETFSTLVLFHVFQHFSPSSEWITSLFIILTYLFFPFIILMPHFFPVHHFNMSFLSCSPF